METAGFEDAVEFLGRSPCTGAGGREGAWGAVGGQSGGGGGGNAHCGGGRADGFHGSSDGDIDAERAPPHLKRTHPQVPVSARLYRQRFRADSPPTDYRAV